MEAELVLNQKPNALRYSIVSQFLISFFREQLQNGIGYEETNEYEPLVEIYNHDWSESLDSVDYNQLSRDEQDNVQWVIGFYKVGYEYTFQYSGIYLSEDGTEVLQHGRVEVDS